MAKKTKLQEKYEGILQEARVSVIGNIPAAIAKLLSQMEAVVTTANQTDALFSEFTNEVFYALYQEVQKAIGEVEADSEAQYLDEDAPYRAIDIAHAAGIDSFLCCYGEKDLDFSEFPLVRIENRSSPVYELCVDRGGNFEIDDAYLRNCENHIERNNGEVFPEEISSLDEKDMMCGFYDAGHHFYSKLPILQSRWDFYYHIRNESVSELLMDMLPVTNLYKYDQSVDYKNAVKSCVEEAKRVFREELKRGLEALPKETEESLKQKKLQVIETQLQSLEKERQKLERSMAKITANRDKVVAKK